MLESFVYAPLLRTKAAEINAYHGLSGSEKRSIFPIFISKPWQNANSFQKTIDKIEGSTRSGIFGFGLDKKFLGGSGKTPAQREFDSLFDPRLGYRNFYDCVDGIPSAVPLFINGGDVNTILRQLGNADEIGRGLIVRFTPQDSPPILNLASSLPPLPNDTVFVVDGGWGRDPLQIQAWMSVTIGRILEKIPDAEIVVMCSTFPDSFSNIVGHDSLHLYERSIFSHIRSLFNQANIIYGDWATTRETQSGGGGKIPPRIDIPSMGSCNIFRADPNIKQSYRDMADLAVNHVCFSNVPSCYGKSLIEATADDNDTDSISITGTQRATEARINIHMTLNCSRDADTNFEEKYVD